MSSIPRFDLKSDLLRFAIDFFKGDIDQTERIRWKIIKLIFYEASRRAMKKISMELCLQAIYRALLVLNDEN